MDYSLMYPPEGQRDNKTLTDEAVKALACFEEASFLGAFAEKLANRTN